MVREYALAVGSPPLPEGVTPLHRANYIQTDEWTFGVDAAIDTTRPFPIRIPWDDLAY